MIKTITSLLWKLLFIILMLLTLLCLPFQLLTKPFVSKRRYRWQSWLVARAWGWLTVVTTGTKVRVSGRDNIPSAGPICFIGNHQSYFDIPTLTGFVGRPMGFIAKQELAKVPILKQWMLQLPSFFLDRDNARQAIKVFQSATQVMREGQAMVIFPEGLRAERGKVAEFHLGSLKLAQMAEATIVPFALDGTWRIMEIDGHIHAARVSLTILPPITPEDPLYKDKIALANHLRSSIEACLKQS
ncbi:MAG: 1-acyl-sn-glycerol-3-phosphate acyltransferase [Candidatus Cloacimonetes bacterium]|nr:1-acyl-sn-glycerol-3-phosphate acyltransferase [Candidatus Cloacimonadota bacterium]